MIEKFFMENKIEDEKLHGGHYQSECQQSVEKLNLHADSSALKFFLLTLAVVNISDNVSSSFL